MKPTTLNEATVFGSEKFSFRMGKKIYHLCDIARDIIPCEGISVSTGERIKTTHTERLFIVREVGKVGYKVFDSKTYGNKEISVLL